jgi:hypothetical protein
VRTLARKVDAIVVPRARERTWDPAMFNMGSETIGAGGVIPWLVAGNNAPQEIKDIAGYVCDGSNDEVELQAALNTQTGHEIWIWGDFWIENIPDGGWGIEVPLRKTIIGMPNEEGSGYNQILDATAGGFTAGNNSALIKLRGSLRNVYVQAWYDNLDAIMWDHAGKIDNCYIETGNNSRSIHQVNGAISVKNSTIYARGGSPFTAPSIHITTGIVNAQHRIIGNVLIGGGMDGLIRKDVAGLMIVSHNRGNGGNGPFIASMRSQWIIVTENVFFGVCYNFDGTEAEDVPNGHVYVVNAHGGIIANNIFENTNAARTSITVRGSSSGVRIEGNYLEDLGREAIRLDLASNCSVVNNFMGYGQYGEGFDGILIANDSNDNFIFGNDVRFEGFGANPSSGVKVADVACENNRIVGNIMNYAYPTAPITDLGTGTSLSWPNDPTYGDNFTGASSGVITNQSRLVQRALETESANPVTPI